jgi:predicted O-linked N-acetylglucosamine transferase (SPINDLY family)
MNKTESLLKLQYDPDNLLALEAAGDHAVIEKKYNIALNLYGRYLKIKTERRIFLKISKIYLILERISIACIYLKVAIDMKYEKKLEDDLRDLLLLFKNKNPLIIKMEENIAKIEDKKLLKERKEFLDLVKKGNTLEAFKIGKKQHDEKRIDGAIQNIWCSIAYRNGEMQTAMTAAFLAFTRNPSDWVILVNMADIFVQLRKQVHALDYAVAAVHINPLNTTAWLNLGAAWDILGKPWESANATKKALEINPKNAPAWTNLGNAYKNSGEQEKAIDAYKQAIKYDPGNLALWSNLLFGINYSEKKSVEEIYEEHLKFGEHFNKIIKEKIINEEKKEDDKINICFISADIRLHPVSYFFLPLWRKINTEKFKIIIMDNFPVKDKITEKFITLDKEYINISEKTDDQVIEIIKNRKIDVLIDMSGHTARNRLKIFARKPVKNQITWLGHPNTTGLKTIEWRITDKYLDPDGTDKYYTEKLLRLPIHAVYMPLIKNEDLINDEKYKVNESPVIKNGYITYGSCNNLAKITDDVVHVWSKILRRVQNSKLMIEAPGLEQIEFKEKTYKRFENNGVNRDRLILISRTSSMQYLRYHEIDIALDPFPYGGGTTTCDLLWMGLPLITFTGDRPMSRIGECFLAKINKTEWVAKNESQYIEIACKLSENIQLLNNIRLSQREIVEKSEIMDSTKYTLNFEKAIVSIVNGENINLSENVQRKDTYDSELKSGNDLLETKKWDDALTIFIELRNKYGPEPNALFGAGLASFHIGDYNRALRFICDALQRKPELDWMIWLAAVYKELNYNLPFYVVIKYLNKNLKNPDLIKNLTNTADKRFEDILTTRGLSIEIKDINEDKSEEGIILNNKIVDDLKAKKYEDILNKYELYSKSKLNQPILLNVSIAAKRLKKYEFAAKCCLNAFAINPLGTGVITNFGNLLTEVKSLADSMFLLEIGSIIFQNDNLIWSNLAIAYLNTGNASWESEYASRRSLNLDPKNTTSLYALAKALNKQGRMDESLNVMKRLVELDPSKKNSDLFSIQYISKLSKEDISQSHFDRSKEISQNYPAGKFKDKNSLIKKDKLINIGFVTGDFVNHPVSYFMIAIIKFLSEYYNIYLYINRPLSEEDVVSSEFKNLIKHNSKNTWLNTHHLNDHELANKISFDKIQILFDLSGHTSYSRLNVFSLKPAPVQITYLGHPNTTGLSSIDWKLSDKYCIPSEIDHLYAEKIARMDIASLNYTPLIKNHSLKNDLLYEVQDSPCLINKYITFGCCNNISKISDDVVEVWSKIIKSVPNSKLLIESPGLHQREFRKSFSDRFVKYGVNKESILLNNRDSKLQYLIYNKIDIALDPFPFNGGTTSCDLLWMGVPLITLKGDSECSRIGYSILSTLDRPEWIANSIDDYVNIAVKLASQLFSNTSIRVNVRKDFEKSSLGNSKIFCPIFKNTIENIWLSEIKDMK